jgi:hypothetical protein
MQLVERYLRDAGNFRNVRSIDRSPRRLFSDPLYAVVGNSTGPFKRGKGTTSGPSESCEGT